MVDIFTVTFIGYTFVVHYAWITKLDGVFLLLGNLIILLGYILYGFIMRRSLYFILLLIIMQCAFNIMFAAEVIVNYQYFSNLGIEKFAYNLAIYIITYSAVYLISNSIYVITDVAVHDKNGEIII